MIFYIDLKLFGVATNHKFSVFYSFLRGIIWADVAYLPKHIDTPLWVLKVAKLLNKTIFTTIEGNMCDISRRNMINSFGSIEKMKKYGIIKVLVQHMYHLKDLVHLLMVLDIVLGRIFHKWK